MRVPNFSTAVGSERLLDTRQMQHCGLPRPDVGAERSKIMAHHMLSAARLFEALDPEPYLLGPSSPLLTCGAFRPFTGFPA